MYFLIAAITSQPFDVAVLVQHAQWFYYLGISPLFYWTMGSYSAILNVGDFFPSVLAEIIGRQSVIIEQISAKWLFVVVTFITASLINRMMPPYFPKSTKKMIGILYVINPIVVYSAGFHGTPIALEVFFLILSFYLLKQQKYVYSAIAYGISTSMYYYPIFSLPLIIYYIYQQGKARSALLYFSFWFISSSVGVIPTIVYDLFLHLPSQSTALGLANSLIGVGPIFPPLFSIYDILVVAGYPYALTQNAYTGLFILGMIAPVISSIFLIRGKFGFNELILIMAIESIAFSLVNPGNTPQYLLAAVPWVILFGSVKRKWTLLIFIYITAILDLITLFLWNPHAFMSYFQSTSPSLLEYTQTFPLSMLYLFGTFYGVALILILILLITHNDKSQTTLGIIQSSYDTKKLQVFHELVKSNCLVGIFTISLSVLVAISLVAPTISHVPTNMPFDNQINTWQITPSQEKVAGMNSTTFTYQMPEVFQALPNYERHFLLSEINISSLPHTVYEWFASNSTYSYNNTEFLAQDFYSSGTFANISIRLLIHGNDYKSTLVRLVPGNFTETSTYPILESSGNFSVESNSSNGWNIVGIDTNLTIVPGYYHLLINGTSRIQNLIAGSNNYPLGVGIYPAFIGNNASHDRTLALLISGNPEPNIALNSIPLKSYKVKNVTYEKMTYQWFALNSTFSVTNSDYLAEMINLPQSITSLSVELMGLGDAPNITLVRLANELPNSQDFHVFAASSKPTVLDTPANGRFMAFNFSGPFALGRYFIIVNSTNNQSTYIVGSTNFPKETGITPLILSGTLDLNDTLALAIVGTSSYKAYQSYSNLTISLPASLLSNVINVTISFHYVNSPSEYPPITVRLPYENFRSNLSSNISVIIMGSFTFGSVVFFCLATWYKLYTDLNFRR